jgi:hypothetical protein
MKTAAVLAAPGVIAVAVTAQAAPIDPPPPFGCQSGAPCRPPQPARWLT